MTELIDQFKVYRHLYPNLAECWIAYLELKKRHYDKHLLEQCASVLECMANGCKDWERDDILRVLLYKQTV